VARYQQSDVRHSVFQLVTTLVPLLVAMVVLYRSLVFPYWVTFLLSVPTAGLLVRTFILMHDCAHGSFFPSRRANDLVGWVTGVLTLTPFGAWRRDHALHHASSGDLDRRGHGDIDTLTVREYLARAPMGKLRYRLFRNPLVMFGLGPIQFILNNRRQPSGASTADRKDSSVASTNLALLLGMTAASFWIGPRAVFLIYFPPMYLAAAAGIWLFYVQHQFEGTYWKDHGDWDYATAAIRGSSYFKLHPILRWFTGSIGLHHVHHLGPRIPNYRLERCHAENALFHDVTVVTLRESVRTLRLTLWDEDRQQLVGFRDVRLTPLPRSDAA
jgi:omega-6 fatty acid desaturase (delta-12 desaturase)